MNLLTNPSFESGWTDDGNRQIPNGWHFWYATDKLNPYSRDTWNAFVAPEVRVLNCAQLPEDECGLFVVDGDYTTKIFKGYGAWDGSLTQVIDLERGVYRLTAFIYPDPVARYDGGIKIPAPDPNSALMRFLAGPTCSHWYSMQPFLTQQWRSWDFFADGVTEIGAEWMFPFALQNSGLFTDDWKLELVESGSDEDCKGLPREQYKRTYLVIPPTATDEQAAQVFISGWRESRRTVGGSYDDAGVADLNDKTAVLYGIPLAERAAYLNFYEWYYPGTQVEFRDLPGTQPPPVTGEFLSIHLQTEVSGWLALVKALARREINLAQALELRRLQAEATGYVSRVKPAWVKLVGNFELAQQIKATSPARRF